MRLSLVACAGAIFAASLASGQSVISAHSGTVQYIEGKVLLDGQAIDPKFGEFPEVKNDQVLETTEGRAEVLLTPGVFLRLAENSSFKMLSNKLSDTAVEIVSGSAMVEADQLLKDNAITLRFKDATIALDKEGLYRLDAAPGLDATPGLDAAAGRLRVYDGQAAVTYGVKTVQAHKAKQVELDETLLATSFDLKDTDSFYRWVSRRAEYIATGNISSAHAAGVHGLNMNVPCAGEASYSADPQAAYTSGTPYCNPYGNPYSGGVYGDSPYGDAYLMNSFYGWSPYGMWAWNPYYGMFTYLPGYGYGYSPFGLAIYSPVTVANVYQPGAYRRSASLVSASALANRNLGPTALAGARSAALAPRVAAPGVIRASNGISGVASPGISPARGASAGGISAGGGVSRSSGVSAGGGSMGGASGAGRATGGASSGGGGRR